MDQKFVADALGVHNKSFGAKRSQANDLTNNPIARNFDWRETALRIKTSGMCQRLIRARGYEKSTRRQGATEKPPTMDFRTGVRNLRHHLPPSNRRICLIVSDIT